MYGVIYGLLRGGASCSQSYYFNQDASNWSIIILAFLIYIILVSYLGLYIWNNVLVNVVTIVKPMTSIFQMWALIIISHLFFPNMVSFADTKAV
jgi:hypothetical protein